MSEQPGWSENDLFLWLVAPTGRLGGIRRVDAMPSDSMEAQTKVVCAAELEMSAQWWQANLR